MKAERLDQRRSEQLAKSELFEENYEGYVGIADVRGQKLLQVKVSVWIRTVT